MCIKSDKANWIYERTNSKDNNYNKVNSAVPKTKSQSVKNQKHFVKD